MGTKWSPDSSHLSSKSIEGSNGPGRPLERQASLPDASQLSSIVKSTEIRMSSSFANAEGTSKAKCVSALDGEKSLWARLVRFSKGKKYGGHDKSPQIATSTREATETGNEERSGECYSSQVNIGKSAMANGIKYALRQRRRSIGLDSAVAYQCSAEEQVTFSFLKSVSTDAPTSESSMSPNQVYQVCEVFGGLSDQEDGNILITQHSDDISGMNNTGRVREEKIGFEYKVVTDMPMHSNIQQEQLSVRDGEMSRVRLVSPQLEDVWDTTRQHYDNTEMSEAKVVTDMPIRSYIDQEQISVNDHEISPVRLVPSQLEDAFDANRQHYGNTEMPESKISESASGSCHEKLQCFHAVATEPLRIQHPAREPRMHNGSCFSWTPTPSNKIHRIVSPINKSSERAMATSHCCITGEILHKPLPRKNCFFHTDVKKPVSNVIAGVSEKDCLDDTGALFIPDTKENVSNTAKETPESPAKSNEAPLQEYSEQLLNSDTFLTHDSQKQEVIQSSFSQAPEAYIEELPESNADTPCRNVNDATERFATIKGHNPGASTAVEDFAIIRYPVVEVAQSSTQIPALDLPARAAPSNSRKSATVAAPSSSRGAGAGARPKSATARVSARTKACIKGTIRLGDLCDPRTRDTYRMNVHLRPSDARSSVQIRYSRGENCVFLFSELSQHENFIEALRQTPALADECSIAMEEIKRPNDELTESVITELNESGPLKIRELETAHRNQLGAYSWSCDGGLISSKALYEFGLEASRNSFSESFESLKKEQGQGKVINTIEKHRSVRLDSIEQMQTAWKQEEDQRLKSLLLQYNATEEPTEYYQEAVYNQEAADFESQLKANIIFKKGQASLRALLRRQENEMRALKAAASQLKQKQKVLERHKSEMAKIEVFIEDLKQRLDGVDNAIDQMQADDAMLAEDALQGMEDQSPEGG